MSDGENTEMEIDEAKETDTRAESTSMEETEGQDTDFRTSESDLRHERDPRRSFGEKPNHPPINQVRHEMVQGSPYPVHLGARGCEQYLNTGKCSYGRKCRFNHPPTHFSPVLPGQNSSLQRRRAHENVVQRGNNECGQRRESEKERTIKAAVQSDEGGIQTAQRLVIAENHSVNGQENLQEQADTERQKREGEEKAQEERSRSLTDNVDQFRQFLQGIGIERNEVDGFEKKQS